jgi:hypothetical protein
MRSHPRVATPNRLYLIFYITKYTQLQGEKTVFVYVLHISQFCLT